MLLDLPVEVLLEITRYLNFKNKLNLMTTCRRLHDLISNATLYEYVNTVARRQAAETIITRFKNKEFNDSQVKTLNTFMLGLPGELMLQLPEIFPNATKVMSYHHRNTFDTEHELNVKRLIESPECNWIKSVRTFNTLDGWKGIWNMLKLHTFSRLVELEISQDGHFEDKKEGFDEFYLVPYFKNAPSLKKLTLHRLTMSLKLLDEIHAICPFIETLELEDVTFNMDNGSLSQAIVPANSVFHLELRNVIDFDKEHLYLDYIPQKYPKLKHLCFDIKSGESLHHDFFWDELFTYRDTEEEMDNSIKGEEATQKAGEDTIRINKTRFISMLPKTITALHMCLTDEDSLKAIAESGMNVATLDFSETVCYYVRRMHYLIPLGDIRTLRSLKVDVKTWGEAFSNEYTWDHITTLTFCYLDDPLCIYQLLSLFPSVEDLHLTVERGIMQGDSKQLAEKIYPNLKRIHIQDSEVHSSFFTFIKHVAPNVEVLDMSCYIDKDLLSINLTGWNLKQCAINVFKPLTKHLRIESKVTIQGVSKTVIFFTPRSAVLLSPTESDYEQLNINSTMAIECDDIDIFKINTVSVKRLGNKLYCG